MRIYKVYGYSSSTKPSERAKCTCTVLRSSITILRLIRCSYGISESFILLLPAQTYVRGFGRRPAQRPAVIQSISHAAKLWEKYNVGQYYPTDTHILWASLNVRFPRPPFESRWLQPISDAQALIQLALAARNCLFLHRVDVVCGNMYFFIVPPSLFFPELAIVQVIRSKSDPARWVVETIEGPRNQKLSEEHCQFIEYEIKKVQDRIADNLSPALTSSSE